MVSRIRPEFNQPTNGVAHDTEAGGVITLNYEWNAALNDWVPRPAASSTVATDVFVDRASDGARINPARDETLVLVRAKTDNLDIALSALLAGINSPAGTYKTYAGVAGTVVPLTGEKVRAVTCIATTAGTMTDPTGQVVPLPANSLFFDSPEGLVGDGVKSYVFSGTASYFVRVLA